MSMDYKYIEQLLERYWQCETSPEEEQILRSFFQQKDVPAELLRYKDLFVYQKIQKEIKLGSDFDEKILRQIEKPVVKAKRISFTSRIAPLYKAAAIIAFVMILGGVANRTYLKEDSLDYNYDSYTDTYNDPQVAYKEISSAIMMVSERINKSKEVLAADSTAAGVKDIEVTKK